MRMNEGLLGSLCAIESHWSLLHLLGVMIKMTAWGEVSPLWIDLLKCQRKGKRVCKGKGENRLMRRNEGVLDSLYDRVALESFTFVGCNDINMRAWGERLAVFLVCKRVALESFCICCNDNVSMWRRETSMKRLA